MIALHANDLQYVRNVLVDGGYSGVNFKLDVISNLQATVQVVKRNELHKFEALPQRWLVEWSFSWVEKCRRLWKNYERQLHTSATMMTLAFMSVLSWRFWKSQTVSKSIILPAPFLHLAVPYGYEQFKPIF